jgi:O-antigen/teichoic acid export membrane protein
MRNEYKPIKHLLLSSLVQWFNSRISYYILALVSSNYYIGILNGYLSIIGLFNPVFITIDNYVIPKTSQVLNESGGQAAKNYVTRILTKVSIPIIGLSVTMIIFSKQIIGLVLGHDYAGFSEVFSILVLINLVVFVTKKYVILSNVFNFQYLLTTTHTVCFIIIASTSYFIINMFGINGVLFSSLVNALTILLILRTMLYKKIKDYSKL